MYVFSPPVLFGLQLLGLLPVSVNHLPLRGVVARFSWTRNLYSFLLVISYCVIICFWLEKSADEHTSGLTAFSQTTFKITSNCSLFATFLGAVVAVGVAATSAKQKILLVEKLREIDFLLQHKLKPPRTRRVSLLIITGAITTVTIEFIHTVYGFKNNKLTLLMLINYLILEYFKIVILFGLLEVMEVVLAVRERFQLVNERVLEVVMRNRSKLLMWTVALPCVETFTMPQEMMMSITGLSEIHWSLCCIVHDINAIYAYHLVTAMIFIFTHLVYHPYVMFVLFGNFQRHMIVFGFSLTWMVLIVAELFVVVFPCSLTVKEAKKTVIVVTKLMGNKMAKPLFNELETFADQMFHRDVEFTACGLFTLQTSLVISVASAVTTYMAIIIQFQTSADDSAKTSTETTPVTAVSTFTSTLDN